MASFLDPIWGVVIIAVGILNLLIRHRGMFIVNGIVLLLVGILNIFSGGVGFWTVFGGFQLVIGAQEIRKYPNYADVS